MTLKYDDDVKLAKGSPIGNALPPGYVFSWLRDDAASEDHIKPIRVQASESVVRSWGVKWTDEEAARLVFRARRASYIEQAAQANDTGLEYRVFMVSEA